MFGIQGIRPHGVGFAEFFPEFTLQGAQRKGATRKPVSSSLSGVQTHSDFLMRPLKPLPKIILAYMNPVIQDL